MKTSIYQIIIILAVLIPQNVQSENPCGTMTPSTDSSSWGIGFIRMNFDSNYKIRGKTVSTNQECYIGKGEITFSNENSPKLNPTDYLYFVSYRTILLKVFQIEGTKFKVCSNTISDGIWVEFDDLSSINLKFNTYISLLANEGNYYYSSDEYTSRRSYTNIGVNLINTCLNLRDEPNLKGKVITCIQNNLAKSTRIGISHIEIMAIKDGWADVIVRLYVFDGNEVDNPDGCASKVINEYRGFVKVMDSNGRPNIWYALSGY